MEQYIVSARKYRPTNFDSVVGQQALATTLKNAIAGGKLAHAYLFCGGRGVGKTSCARIFAKTINCTHRTPAGEACNECDSCRQFNEGRSLNILELDAASHNGVEDIKSLTEQVMVPPTAGRYRVFIIDEVHMLSTQAFNAFLKTLEEPPAHAIFILATTEKHKIIPTILSRCQIYDFNRIGIADMVSHMGRVAAAEGITAEPSALSVIARKADGAMRDALSIFDQVAACTGGNITYAATIENLNVLDRSYYRRLTDAFIAQDVATALLIYKEVRDKGFDSQFFINGLGQYMRDVMVATNPATAALVEAPDDERAALAEIGARLHPTFLYKAMELCNDADFNFRQATNKQFLIELTLIRLCQLLSPSSETDGDDGGQLKPLVKADTPTPAFTAAAAPAAATVTGAVKPASSLRAAPAPSQKREHVPSYNVGDFSLRMSAAAPVAQPAAEASSPQAPRTKPFTDADFENGWRAFIDEHRNEPFLVSAMSQTMPEPSASGKGYQIRVAVPLMAEKISEKKGEILEYIRNRLGNDSVDFDIVRVEGELPPAYWPEQKVLEYMLEKHPALADMMKKFKMRLG